MKKQPQQKGFIILFAVLISAIILLIGAGMFRISVKESILSSAARESTLAFFAADTAIECVLYHDIQATPRPFPIPVPVLPAPPAPNDIECDSQNVPILGPAGDTYLLRMGFENETCAFVTIDKSNLPEVEVFSRGYNICDGDEPDTENPLLLERVLDVKYQGF